MTYLLLVDDNFHYMDQSERHESGRFATLEEAIAAAKSIVDSYLIDAQLPGMTADELFRSYTSFGEDPFVVTDGGASGEVLFSAWDYARQRCLEICAGTEEERLEEKLDRVEGICIRLAAAHAKGVVHGDLHSGRIFTASDGRVDIDFSPKDMALPGSSPEQLLGRAADARSDVFAAACVSYELLTGHVPFGGDTFHAACYRILHEEPTDPRQFLPGLAAPLVTWLQRGLAKEPARRFADGGDMLEALRRLRVPVQSAQPTLASRRQEAASLCARGDADAMARLVERLKGPDGNDVALAVLAIAPQGAAAIPTLIAVLSDRETPASVRGITAQALGRHGPAAQEAVPALARAMGSVRHHGLALDAAYAMLPILGIETLTKAVLSGVPLDRGRAMEALALAAEAGRPAVSTLLQVARDPRDPLRDAAWSTLRGIGGDEVVAAIVEMCTEPLVVTVPRPERRSPDAVDSDIYLLNPSAHSFEAKTSARFQVTVDDLSGESVEHGPVACELVLAPASATKAGEILGWELDSSLFFQISYRRIGENQWKHFGMDLKRCACGGRLPLLGSHGFLKDQYPVNENGTRD